MEFTLMVIQEQLLNWISSSGLVSLGVIDALDAIFIWKKKKKSLLLFNMTSAIMEAQHVWDFNNIFSFIPAAVISSLIKL